MTGVFPSCVPWLPVPRRRIRNSLVWVQTPGSVTVECGCRPQDPLQFSVCADPRIRYSLVCVQDPLQFSVGAGSATV